VIYRGRDLDVLSLWSQYVTLPPRIKHPLPTFLDLVACPNPEHHTKKHHFQINTAKPLVHCFANCGISGSYEHAISMIERCDGREATKAILRHTRVPLGGVKDQAAYEGLRKRSDGPDELANDTAAFNGGAYSFLPTAARAYLDSRGIDEHARLQWQIGYDDATERIVIPAYDEKNQLRFLIRRSVGTRQPKYLYTAGAIKTNILFGLVYTDHSIVYDLGLVLTEGSLDTIRLHQNGIRSAVGILGTGLSQRQVRLIDSLRPPRILCFFDRDGAGMSNIMLAREKLRYPMSVCLYPPGRSDPAEMTREEVVKSIETALPIAKFSRRVKDLSRR
jgi:DNA primase